MEKRAAFGNRWLPYGLLAPQILVTSVFFYWPAAQAVRQSFLVEDAFGLSSSFVGLENYAALLSQPSYYHTLATTFLFAAAVTVSSLALSLLLAAMADREIRGATAYRTFLIWPYAVAPAVAGVLWVFMLDPSLGILARGLRGLGLDWNPRLNGTHALVMVVLASAWKQVSYNFLFFLATETLVYKGYSDGRGGGNLGGSAAQSVILMVIVIGLTAVQFRFVERKVVY